MSDLNRRQFVSLTVAAAATAAAACTGCLCSDALAAQPPTSAPSSKGPVDVGTLAEYPKDGTIVDKWSKSDRVMVVRHEGKIYALNSTCTHKNAALRVKDGEINCPSHGSKFTPQGTSTKGPAKGSLFRYGISVNDKGKIIVDKTKQFAEKDWESAGAFIKA
ncbi:MAG TPA: Rieske (2Fe-2S) protein [Tepidisphaeraceae bacterium]|nr:Rieske (2Fe-2S) protein [Tepidisphaeraceae bacterium]